MNDKTEELSLPEKIRKQLLESGVGSLNDFGYPYASIDNILTDAVYKLFFKKQLEEVISDCDTRRVLNKHILKSVCIELLVEIK